MTRSVKRVAAVHDLSGFGRSSLAVIIPILSSMKIQVCPLPTAVLSTHTGGFEGFSFVDLTESMGGFIDHWMSLGIEFDCIYSGFLGSVRQMDILSEWIDASGPRRPLVLIDPVLGDDGRLYATMTPEIVAGMRAYAARADIITPNLTEAALLLDEPYIAAPDAQEIVRLLRGLSRLGPGTVIITGIPESSDDGRFCVMARDGADGSIWKSSYAGIPQYYPGTGDAFASVAAGAILQGDSLPMAVERAVHFVSAAIRASYGYRTPAREGVCLERVLETLASPLPYCSFERID